MNWLTPKSEDTIAVACMSMAIVLYVVLVVLHIYGLGDTTIGQLLEMLN